MHRLVYESFFAVNDKTSLLYLSENGMQEIRGPSINFNAYCCLLGKWTVYCIFKSIDLRSGIVQSLVIPNLYLSDPKMIPK